MTNKTWTRAGAFACAALLTSLAIAQPGTIRRFALADNPVALTRLAQPSTYFDKVGRKFAILGTESGSFEAWAYPLKLVRDFEFSFFVGSSTEPIRGNAIARFVTARPEATTITYAYQSFTVRATYCTPVDQPGALVLLDVDATEPLSIVCSFLPVLQPMWPAGIGGQYAAWNDEVRAYLISEPTRKNHAFIGSPSAEGISYTPAHMLSDAPNQFRIRIASPDSVRDRTIVIAMAGGKGTREDVRSAYVRLLRDPEGLYRETARHYASLRAETMEVETPDRQLNLAFEWGKVAYDNLLVDHPDLGRGLVAGLGPSGPGGRPGFGWFFGGDAFINAFSLDGYGAFGTVRDALAFTRKWQRADGKMAHELSQSAGYVDWFKDYPYAYIHGDTSPFYIAAMYDYYIATGDTAFVRQSWTSVRKAYEWSRGTDEDGDGLMDNARAGLGASEYGSLTGVQSDIYTAAVWVRALNVLGPLARAAGEPEFAASVEPLRRKAAASFNGKFWDEQRGQYAYAFDAAGTRVPLVSPWSSVGMMWGLGDSARSARTLEKLSAAELSTDWGTRSISNRSSLYEPLNYNYGAVWPFLTSWVAAAQYAHHCPLQGFGSLMASVRHTFDNGAGVVTEVFSGSANVWPQEAVPHQGFCTAGVMLPFVRGMLGLAPDAVEGALTFAPHFPADWTSVRIRRCRVGDREINLEYARSRNRVELRAQCIRGGPVLLHCAPALGVGTRITAVRVNGAPLRFTAIVSPQTVQPEFAFTLTDSARVVVEFIPGVELLPPATETRTGDTNRGLKIIRTALNGNHLRVVVEGLSGSTYVLGAANPARIASVSGARRNAQGVSITMPAGPAGEFVRTEFVITMSEELQGEGE